MQGHTIATSRVPTHHNLATARAAEQPQRHGGGHNQTNPLNTRDQEHDKRIARQRETTRSRPLRRNNSNRERNQVPPPSIRIHVSPSPTTQRLPSPQHWSSNEVFEEIFQNIAFKSANGSIRLVAAPNTGHLTKYSKKTSKTSPSKGKWKHQIGGSSQHWSSNKVFAENFQNVAFKSANGSIRLGAENKRCAQKPHGWQKAKTDNTTYPHQELVTLSQTGAAQICFHQAIAKQEDKRIS